MKRKLVKQGLRALTLTVPSSWVQKNNLAQGDEVELNEIDNTLQISTEHRQPLKGITVDVSGLLPRLADRFIARAYQKGYDRIVVKYDSPELMLAIKDKVPELLGFEILNTGKNMLEIQVIASQLDLDFDIMLRRGLLLLMDMAQTCHDAWKNGDRQALENVFHQDFEVNKFMYFCLRSLNTSGKMMNFGMSILYYLIESLEDLGDELKALGNSLAKIKPDKELLHAIAKMNQMFRMSYDFFYKPDKEKAVEAFRLSQEISAMVGKLLRTKDNALMQALISIDFSTRIIYHLTTMRLDTLEQLGGEQQPAGRSRHQTLVRH